MAVPDALHYLFKAVEFPEVRTLYLHHALETVQVDHSIFLQFLGACAKLQTLGLGNLKFVVPNHIEDDTSIPKSVKEGRIFTSVLQSLPRSISNLNLAFRYEGPVLDSPQLQWLENCDLDGEWFLPNLRVLSVNFVVSEFKGPMAGRDSLVATIRRFSRRRQGTKPMPFIIQYTHELIEKASFYVFYGYERPEELDQDLQEGDGGEEDNGDDEEGGNREDEDEDDGDDEGEEDGDDEEEEDEDGEEGDTDGEIEESDDGDGEEQEESDTEKEEREEGDGEANVEGVEEDIDDLVKGGNGDADED